MSTAQYAIDIAASMPEGAKTAAQLDDLSRKLIDAGLGAEQLHDAVAMASNALAAAEAKAAAAAGALAEGNKEFALLERAALQAAKAQEKAAQLGVVPPDVAQNLAAASAALDAHTVKLHGLERAARDAAAEEKRLGVVAANTKQAHAAGLTALNQKSNAERKLAEEAKRLAAAEEKSFKKAESVSGLNNLFDLKDALSSTQGAALVAAGAMVGLVTALVAVTAAVIAGTLAIAAWAVKLGDANRAAALHTEAINAMDPAMAALSASFGALEDETGLGADKLRALTKDLRAAKVAAAQMPAALEAAALAEKALGEGGSREFIDQIKAGKLSVDEFSANARHKLGGIVQRQLLGLDAQAVRFKKNISNLFGSLNIEPALMGLETLVALFDKNTASGQAMQFLFEKVFQPLIDNAEKAAFIVEAFVLGFLIGLTKLYIALKPAIKAVSEFFGFKDTSLADVLAIATKAGEYAAYLFAGFAATMVVLGVAFAGAVAVAVAFQVAIWAMIAAVVAASVAIGVAFYQAWVFVWDFLTGLPAKMIELGGQLMHGLADGISNAAGAVIGAITGAVGGAIDSAKKLLGIASPSRVFAAIGENTAEGFAQGVDETTPEAQASLTSMVEPPKPVTPGQGNTTTTTDNSRGSLVININGADADVTQQVLKLLEQWAGHSGGAEPEPV